MSPTTTYALVMLVAGVGVPVLAALNAALGVRLASPFAAGVILFTVALGAAIVTLLITGPAPLAKAPEAPKHLFLAGFLVAFYVLSITWFCRKLFSSMKKAAFVESKQLSLQTV